MSGQQSKAGRVMVYILNSGNLYGTERMALATLAGMDEYKRRVVFAPRPLGTASVATAAREAGMEAVSFQTRWDFIRALLPFFLRYRSVDVIGTGVAQGYMCHVLAKLMLVRLRQLQVTHGGTEDWHAYGRKRLLNRIPVRVVAVSDFVRSKLEEHGVRPHAISVIENFLADAQISKYPQRRPYDPALPSASPVDPARVRVAIVSRVNPIKKVDLLVAAIERHGLAEFQFDVYGTGKDLETLEARSAVLPNIRFHDFVGDVHQRMADADFLLHLCPDEPFGLVILEAFLSRIVAIVPDAGGAGGLVEPGKTGVRFRAGDIDDLALALQRARSASGESLQRLADAGRATLDSKFSQREGVRRYREALATEV
ncbi:MAG: glycosyltransferase family 4 protein [Caldimonas sp.]